MKKTAAELLVGTTVIIGLVGIAVLLLLFGEFAGAGAKSYLVYMELNDASGLTPSSHVTLNGVPAGSIHEITSAPDPRDGVRLAIHVIEGVRIPRDVKVSLDRGLVGEATLSMRAQPLAAGAPDPGFLSEGDTLKADAKGMIEQIAGMFEGKLATFSEAASSFTKLSETLTRAGERLEDALTPRTPAEVDSGEAPANLMSTIARFDETVGAAKAWLGDDTVRTDAKQAIARMKDLVETASGAVESWTRTAAALSENAQRLGNAGESAIVDFAATTRALSETITEAQTIMAKMNRGEGTAGMLLNNPDLYRSMDAAAVRLERALTEAQLLFEKYRKEGLPIRF